ncbi:exocyst complex component 7-like isoform X3 [Pteropus vampyrus]|uniref:Exocyst complex component 7-like isoform X3 n=1 Tax=Pteropus vampyrus TaxID=132908 RepID=A0A6P3RP12_PTEVA|nr:exocyst complex component 7-like isoform X3 [Pteropus vampyrus]
MNVYYQIRSSQLDRSIRGLKEHFRKSSSSSGVPYSPAVPNKRKDTPTKKPVKRPVTAVGRVPALSMPRELCLAFTEGCRPPGFEVPQALPPGRALGV